MEVEDGSLLVDERADRGLGNSGRILYMFSGRSSPDPPLASLPSLFSFSRRDLMDVPVPAISPSHAKAQDHHGQETFLIALGG
jgi:hypothetical protein